MVTTMTDRQIDKTIALPLMHVRRVITHIVDTVVTDKLTDRQMTN